MVRSTLVLVRIWLGVLRVVCDDIAWCVRDVCRKTTNACRKRQSVVGKFILTDKA
jgi:hypothetical protein